MFLNLTKSHQLNIVHKTLFISLLKDDVKFIMTGDHFQHVHNHEKNTSDT